MLSVGADIGGSHITCCLFDHGSKNLVIKSATQKKVDRFGTAGEILSAWAEAISETIRKSESRVESIGLAMPGPFDYFNGVSLVQGVDKFESIYKMNIRQELSRRVSLKPERIRFINDASAFTIAESFLSDAGKFERCAGITLGTGFGSAFTIGGKPVVEADEVPKGGVLFDKVYNGKIADDLFSSRGLVNMWFEKTGQQCEGVFALSELAKTNAEARGLFQSFGEDMGTFLKPWLTKFDAQCLVLGGNISRAFDLFQKPLQLALGDVNIYVSGYGEKAAIIGAARLSEDAYYNSIADVLKVM